MPVPLFSFIHFILFFLFCVKDGLEGGKEPFLSVHPKSPKVVADWIAQFGL
jgi:hypothetical protein